MTQSYNASSIQVLEDLEHIRLRPGMYIGSQDSEGVRQILKELVDNVLDEWMEGHATTLSVDIDTEAHTFRVIDDGRGIPIETHAKTGESTLTTVFTNLQAGGKFSKDSYAISVGLHGVGLKATNALSDVLVARVWRKGHCYEQEFHKGDPTTKKPRRNKKLNKRGKHGTDIFFHPDEEIFGNSRIDIPAVTRWLEECVHLCPGLSLNLLVDGEVKRKLQSGGLGHMVADMASRGKHAGMHAPVVVSSEKGEVSASFLWSEGEGDHWFSACNASSTPEGGKHVDGCLKAVGAALGPYTKKRKVDAKDLVDGLYAAVHVLVAEPQFKSQTKSRLLNNEVRDSVYDIVYPQLKSFFDQNKKLAEKIVARASQIRKARDSYKKLRQAINKKVVKKDTKGVLPDKLVEAMHCKPEHRELFLVEGDSAGGSAKLARDPEYQEVLPLKGKIPNAIQRADSLVMKNSEISSIITATGVRLGEDGTFSDLSNLRVGRVLLLMDADPDGLHISSLTLSFFCKWIPDLVRAGKLYIVDSPLFLGTYKGKQWFSHSLEELEKEVGVSASKMHVSRIKGHGEVNYPVLRRYAMDPSTRKLWKISLGDDDTDVMFSLMGPDSSGRKSLFGLV